MAVFSAFARARFPMEAILTAFPTVASDSNCRLNNPAMTGLDSVARGQLLAPHVWREDAVRDGLVYEFRCASRHWSVLLMATTG